MRIAFTITDLSGGGAARVATVLCNEWHGMGHEVHLITFEDHGTPSFFDVSEGVQRHQLAAARSRGGPLGFALTNLLRLFRLRGLFGRLRPDVSISFLLEANVVSAVAALGLQIPTIVAERNHPGFHREPAIKRTLRRLVYPWSSALCVQTDEIGVWCARHLNLKAVTIPNPAPAVSPGAAWSSAPGLDSRFRVIGLGRLERQKGFERLIESFGLAAASHPDWDLVIFGEGAERRPLELLIEKLQLETRVSLPGVTGEPEVELRKSDMFVHTAHYEGFPNAILEAAVEGLCIVAVDSPGAASEILDDGACGVLVADGVEGLAREMSRLMGSPSLRRDYGLKAKARAAGLAPTSIARKWIDLADRLIRARASGATATAA